MNDSQKSLTARERIERAVEQAYDFMASAVFDPEDASAWLRFRIDSKDGAPLTQPVAYHVSEIDDMSDERLRKMVASLSPLFQNN